MMGKARVLLVYKHYSPQTGGIETAVRQYAKWYLGLGYQVKVLCCSASSIKTRKEFIDGVEVVRCGTFFNVKSVPISPSFFAHYLRETGWADLVHINIQFPLASVGYFLVKNLRSSRWLVSYHMDVHRQKFLKRLTYIFDKYLLERADAVITSSPCLRKYSEVLSGIVRDIKVLPFSVEISNDIVSVRGSDEVSRDDIAPRYFIFFGRLVEYKGTRPLVAAIQRVVVEKPDIRFVVFGRGPEQSAFDQLAKENPQQVTVIPEFVSESRKYELISHAAAVLFPSVYPSEAFGIAQLEAMACGKPIINCWLKSGVNWVAPDGECAITVPPHDVDALVAAICELHANPKRCNELGQAARKRFINEFSEPVVAERFQRLVRSVMD